MSERVYSVGLCTLAAVCLVLAPTVSLLAAPNNTGVAQPSRYYYLFPNSGSGVKFLTLQTNTRARGMGEVSAALTDNPAGFMFNPAGLARTHQIASNVSYCNWLQNLHLDMKIVDFASTLSLKELGVLGFSAQLHTYGTILYTDETGSPLGEATPYVLALTGGYAIDLLPNVAAGANLKLLREHFSDIGAGLERGDNNATTFGFDFGVMVFDLLPQLTITGDEMGFAEQSGSFAQLTREFGHPRHQGLSLGFCIRNIGPKLKYSDRYDIGDPLPHNLILGSAFRVIDSDPIGFLVAGDISRLIISGMDDLSDGMQLNCGAEFNIFRLLDLRGGCVHSATDGSKYFTFGLGVGVDKMKFNYSYVPDGQEARWLAKTSFFELSAHF